MSDVVTHGGNREAIAALTQQSAHDLLDFSANINPLGVPQNLQPVLQQALTELCDYPNPDYPELVAAIAKWHHAPTANVTVGNGAVQLIFELANALKAPEALLLAPTFGEYARAFHHAGTTVRYLTLAAAQNFVVDVATVIADLAAHPQTRVVCLCNPNNPSGQCISDDALVPLVAYCNRHDLTLILDEAFMDLTVTANHGWANRLTARDNVVVVRSVTKLFAVPGLRLGYALTASVQLQQALRDYSEPWTVNILAARFGQHMFEQQTYLAATATWLQTEQPWLQQHLRQIPYLQVVPSTTSYILLKSQVPHLRERLWQAGILIRDCANYVGLTPGYYRVAVKDHAANQKLMRALWQLTDFQINGVKIIEKTLNRWGHQRFRQDQRHVGVAGRFASPVDGAAL
ncbi:threonine-phosphate decarboxylase CobD [Levilactobacillus cerevisiae]|uniref:threonine-phosphate decarboxylase CobD n=1 Tax=Levilactobacillus cerevisiae TaxID=1704076 RepID=UPI000F7AFC9F|nr:threonine-phosphate decarboxylase CobD [Levilactobacillus cerevisiae]